MSFAFLLLADSGGIEDVTLFGQLLEVEAPDNQHSIDATQEAAAVSVSDNYFSIALDSGGIEISADDTITEVE